MAKDRRTTRKPKRFEDEEVPVVPSASKPRGQAKLKSVSRSTIRKAPAKAVKKGTKSPQLLYANCQLNKKEKASLFLRRTKRNLNCRTQQKSTPISRDRILRVMTRSCRCLSC